MTLIGHKQTRIMKWPFVMCKHWDLCRRGRLPSRPEVELRSTWGKCVKCVGKYHKLTWGRPEVDLRSTSRSTSSALGPPDSQKKQYMTLGPKFFCSSKMAVTRRRSKLWWRISHQSKALDVSYLSSLSKRDLKHCESFLQKFACDLGFAAYQIFCPKGPCGTS